MEAFSTFVSWAWGDSLFDHMSPTIAILHACQLPQAMITQIRAQTISAVEIFFLFLKSCDGQIENWQTQLHSAC